MTHLLLFGKLLPHASSHFISHESSRYEKREQQDEQIRRDQLLFFHRGVYLVNSFHQLHPSVGQKLKDRDLTVS